MTLRKIVVLGTGGTIAGTASSATDNVGYTAGQVAVATLVSGIAAPAGFAVVSEQVAQVDSKDMAVAIWHQLAKRCAESLADANVAGIVITHGTDTIEETAYFLHAVLDAAKPVVLTCAMRPASSLGADGPRNIADAVSVAAASGARGVVVVCAGVVHAAPDISKIHHYRLDPFSSGEAGPIGRVEESVVRLHRDWPAGHASHARALDRMAAGPVPRVEIVTSHAGAGGAIVQALVTQGVDGLVVAATGNGTVHVELLAALLAAQSSGVKIVRASRCVEGRVMAHASDVLPGSPLPPVKARIELMLQLLAR